MLKKSPTKWDSSIHRKFKEAYEKFDIGRISKDKFRKVVTKDLNIKASRNFYKKLSNNDYNYSKIVQSLKIGKDVETYGTKIVISYIISR